MRNVLLGGAALAFAERFGSRRGGRTWPHSGRRRFIKNSGALVWKRALGRTNGAQWRPTGCLETRACVLLAWGWLRRVSPPTSAGFCHFPPARQFWLEARRRENAGHARPNPAPTAPLRHLRGAPPARGRRASLTGPAAAREARAPQQRAVRPRRASGHQEDVGCWERCLHPAGGRVGVDGAAVLDGHAARIGHRRVAPVQIARAVRHVNVGPVCVL